MEVRSGLLGHIASVREYNPVSEIREIFACEMACFSFFRF